MKILLDVEFDGLPPTVNHLHRSRNGHRYKTSEARNWQEATAGLMLSKSKCECYTKAVSLSIIFETNDRRRWDIDNRVKALQDCLSKAKIIKDDAQIQELKVKREYGEQVKTRIVLMEYEDKKVK